MLYEKLFVDDSGAIEDVYARGNKGYPIDAYKKYTKQHHQFSDSYPKLHMMMFDDPEFNTLTDILHSLEDYIVNEKAKAVLEKLNLPPHRFIPVKVYRKEKGFLFKTAKAYDYYWFHHDCSNIVNYHDFIDFDKSMIRLYRKKELIGNKIQSLDDIYTLRQQNGIL